MRSSDIFEILYLLISNFYLNFLPVKILFSFRLLIAIAGGTGIFEIKKLVIKY